MMPKPSPDTASDRTADEVRRRPPIAPAPSSPLLRLSRGLTPAVRRWLLLGGLLLVGVMAAITLPRYLAASMTSGPAPNTPAQLRSAGPGARVAIALEVTAMPAANLLQGDLLVRESDDSYQRTSQVVEVQLTKTTSVVMGQRSDIQFAAILQVSGRTSGSDDNIVIVRAEQIVILTDVVTVR
jgi:hypothetical protein